MISTLATLVACLTVLQVSAIRHDAPLSDAQRVVSHLQGLMPLHAAAVPTRFKRQVQNESSTSDDQPPPPPQLQHVRFNFNKCCKKIPKLINMKSVKECFKSLRPVPPPPGGSGGPPPPTTGSTGEPLPTSDGPGLPLPTSDGAGGPPTSPPPTTDALLTPAEGTDDREFEENDAGVTVEILVGIDEQNSTTSGQLRNRPGAKGCKGGRQGTRRGRVACAMECAFGKENLIKDGEVDQTAFAAYIDKYMQEKNATIWKDAIDAALKNCSVSVPASIKREQNCTSGSFEMVQCMNRQIFVNCPESRWKAGDERCDACRTEQRNCWPKRGQRKRQQQCPRNETQGVQA